jgi:hypothetical protein
MEYLKFYRYVKLNLIFAFLSISAPFIESSYITQVFKKQPLKSI